MRDLVVLVALVFVGLSLTIFLGAGMHDWQIAAHPVDPDADVSSGLFPAGSPRASHTR